MERELIIIVCNDDDHKAKLERHEQLAEGMNIKFIKYDELSDDQKKMVKGKPPFKKAPRIKAS